MAVDGRACQLKERTLGVEVFGRDPDYDTNLDPVVRIAAGEIRKRIAQYYHEPGHETEMRIDLPSGTYVPEFHPSPVTIPQANPARFEAFLKSPPGWAAVGTIVAVTVAAAAWRTPKGPLDRFWEPVWDSGSVLLSIGGAGIAEEVSAAAPPNSLELSVT